MSQSTPDNEPGNYAGDAEEVLKHVVADKYPDCLNHNDYKLDVIVDDDTKMPKAIGGISFGDGSRLIEVPFEIAAKMQMLGVGVDKR